MKSNIIMAFMMVLLCLGCGADIAMERPTDTAEGAVGDEQVGDDLAVDDNSPEGCSFGNISIQCKADADCHFPGPCQTGGSCAWEMDGPLCVKKCAYDSACAEGDVCLNGACCTPINSCEDRECGDDGCGTICGGGCAGQQNICVNGLCVCEPNCAGKSCGDDGCGGECGACAENHVCLDDNTCCTTTCEGKECGPDGCGGECGQCSFPNDICTAEQTCFCLPDCSDKHCGDDGCGGECWKCPEDETCVNGECVACKPQCDGKVCGPDNCGGVCGKCLENFICDINGQCVCMPDSCADKECGPDGCGGVCGECGDDSFCMPDGWCCKPQCDNKECGSNGCGEECPNKCLGVEKCWENMVCIPKDEYGAMCLNGEDDDKDGAPDCFDSGGCEYDTVGYIKIITSAYSSMWAFCPSNDDDTASCQVSYDLENGASNGFFANLGCSTKNYFWGKVKVGYATTVEISAVSLVGDMDLPFAAFRIYYPGPSASDAIPTTPPFFLQWGEVWKQPMIGGETVLAVFDPSCPEDTPFCPVP